MTSGRPKKDYRRQNKRFALEAWQAAAVFSHISDTNDCILQTRKSETSGLKHLHFDIICVPHIKRRWICLQDVTSVASCQIYRYNSASFRKECDCLSAACNAYKDIWWRKSTAFIMFDDEVTFSLQAVLAMVWAQRGSPPESKENQGKVVWTLPFS